MPWNGVGPADACGTAGGGPHGVVLVLVTGVTGVVVVVAVVVVPIVA